MRNYHNSLEQDQKWYGQSHSEFYENCISQIYNKDFQPAAEAMDEGQKFLRNLQSRAEELEIHEHTHLVFSKKTSMVFSNLAE